MTSYRTISQKDLNRLAKNTNGNDMNPNKRIEVTCCFCGRSIRYEHATKLIVVPPEEDGGDQVLYCHGAHLRAAILDEIVLLPSVTDEIAGDQSR